MKRLIALFVQISVAICGYSQGNTKTTGFCRPKDRTESSVKKQQIISLSEETFESVSKFSYGFLKQGVNTAVGVGESLIELPDNLILAFKEYSDVNSDVFLYWGEYTLESITESVANIYENINSCDPERIGEAAFDAFYTIASAKGGVKSAESLSKVGGNLASKFGLKYHYTSVEGAKGIQKAGLKTGSGGQSFTTYDGYLTGTEAKVKLALPQKDPPTMRVTIGGNVKPQEIRKVKENFGQPGGGFEQIFYEDIPADKIISVDPIPKYPTISAKAVRMIGESSNVAVSYATPIIGPLVAKENALNNNEGGHELNAKINTIVFLEESISPGKTMLFEKDGIRFIGINSVDIEKMTSDFLDAITGEMAEIPDSPRSRARNEVVPPFIRTQRGL